MTQRSQMEWRICTENKIWLDTRAKSIVCGDGPYMDQSVRHTGAPPISIHYMI